MLRSDPANHRSESIIFVTKAISTNAIDTKVDAGDKESRCYLKIVPLEEANFSDSSLPFHAYFAAK
jgi:hypothetical protein